MCNKNSIVLCIIISQLRVALLQISLRDPRSWSMITHQCSDIYVVASFVVRRKERCSGSAAFKALRQ